MISEGQAAQAVGVGLEATPPTRPGRGFWRESWVRLRQNRLGMAAALLILLMTGIAIAAPVLSAILTHHGYQDIDLDTRSPRRARPATCSARTIWATTR